MKVGDYQQNCEIIDYSFQGLGITKIDNRVIFIPYAKVGERHDIQITSLKKNFGYGTIVGYTENKKICQYYYKCGGCNLLHLSYKQQLAMKNTVVHNYLKRSGLSANLNTIIPSPSQFEYRNKLTLSTVMEFGTLRLGLRQKKSHTVVPITICQNVNREISQLVPIIEDCLNQIQEVSYNSKTKTGNIKHIMIRANKNQHLVTVVTKTGRVKDMDTFITLMCTRGITNININKQQLDNQQILGKKSNSISGNQTLLLPIADKNFRVKDKSFFQVNIEINNLIIKYLQQHIDFQNKTILDAFCGTGTIGLSLGARDSKIIGIDLEQSAIEMARENAKNFGNQNASYICSDIEQGIASLNYEFDIVIIDPPRQGIFEHFTNLLLTTLPKQIVYISCDANTLFRDLKILSEKYEIEKIQPFDMFPNTYHVENVVLMMRK